MKTFTSTTFAILFAATALTAASFTASASNTAFKPASVLSPATTLSTIKAAPAPSGRGKEILSSAGSVNKIWVAGNVKVLLTQSDNEEIRGEEGFDAEKTSVQTNGQTLFINSMADHQVTVHVALKDLQRIEAAGSAVVVMSNNFDIKYLQLFLNQSAKVKVNAVVGSLYTVINDDATLKINGSANEHTLMASNLRSIRFGDFVCTNTKSVPAKAMSVALLAR